jgi:hypothetical protein
MLTTTGVACVVVSVATAWRNPNLPTSAAFVVVNVVGSSDDV